MIDTKNHIYNQLSRLYDASRYFYGNKQPNTYIPSVESHGGKIEWKNIIGKELQ